MDTIEKIRIFYKNEINRINLNNLNLAYGELIYLEGELIGVGLLEDPIIKPYYNGFKESLIKAMNK